MIHDLNLYLKNKKEIIITPVTKDYIELTRNWYESLKQIKCDHLALVVALDLECYEYLLKYKIPVISSKFNIKTNNTLEEWRINEKNYKIYDILKIVKDYNVDIFHSEVDIVFFKNPIEYVKNQILNDYDCCVLSDRRFNHFYAKRDNSFDSHLDKNTGTVKIFDKSYHIVHGIENFGFSYIPKTKKNINFWDKMHEGSEYFKKFENKSQNEGSLQTILINAVKDFNMNVKILNPFEFVNGTIWDIPYLKEKVKDNCYLLHYNSSEGKTPEESKNLKVNKMKENGHWYID